MKRKTATVELFTLRDLGGELILAIRRMRLSGTR
jgi:hypothetical protein